MMSTEANKAVFRRFYEEVFSQGRVEVIDELGDPNFLDHTPLPGQPAGLDGVRYAVTLFRTAFPDLRITVEHLVAEGDKVASRITVRGTHQGEFNGIPPTGKQVTITGLEMARFANGKGVERWGQFDNLGLMQQLGVIPAPEQVGS